MKKSCNHRSFRTIYKVINFHSTFCKKGGQGYSCEQCGKSCVLKWKGCKNLKRFSIKSLLTYFLRMVPAIIFVGLFVRGDISAGGAILLTIIYHLVAMWVIITYSSHLKIVEK